MAAESKNPIRVLVAEDSPTARDFLVWLLRSDPELQVVGAAGDGREAVLMAARLRPDVIVMDVHMPRMDGPAACRQIMRETPTPVVMVSATVSPKDLGPTFNALCVGALAAVEKPTGPAAPNYEELRERLITTVKRMSQVKVAAYRPRDGAAASPPGPPLVSPAGNGRVAVVAIAASTGGPAALHHILMALPADFPIPILIAQHICPGFGMGLAEWLSQVTALPVATAQQGERLAPGRVLVAPDYRHMLIRPGGRILLTMALSGKDPCPSTDQFFTSVAIAYGAKALGVILTGMARGGVEGLRQLKARGGRILAQDEASAVVFDMPREAIAAGLADQVVPLEQMAEAIVAMV